MGYAWEKAQTRGIYSLFLRCVTARGSCTGPVTVGHTRHKACKSVLFTNRFPDVKIKLHQVNKKKLHQVYICCKQLCYVGMLESI